MEAEAYDELYELEPNHWWYSGMRQITERILTPVLGANTSLNILDAGCGVGGNLTALLRFGHVTGVDYSTLALSYANKSHAGQLARGTVEALPYQDNTFDLVTSFDVLYCYEVEDDSRAFREFARVTRPGGHILVRLPALPLLRGPHDTFVHGIRRYTTNDLKQKMADANLVILRTTYANALLMPLIFAIRKVQSLEVALGSTPKSDVTPTPELAAKLLKGVLGVESRWIGSGHSFPAGVSIFCLAVKPLNPGTARS